MSSAAAAPRPSLVTAPFVRLAAATLAAGPTFFVSAAIAALGSALLVARRTVLGQPATA